MAPDQPSTTRRNFLKAAGATAVGASIAGCNTSGPGGKKDTPTAENPSTTDDNNSTPQNSPPQVSVEDADIQITWSPDLDQRSELPDDQVADVTLSAGKNASLEDVELYLEHGEETTSLGKGKEQVKLPANQLPEGESQVYAEDTSSGKTSQKHTISKQVPGNFLIDWNDLSNWDTIYSFDDFHYQHSRIWNQRQEWNEQKAYTDMINTLDTKGKKTQYERGVSQYYPWEEQVWKKSWFQELRATEDVLRAASTATQTHQNDIEGLDARSRENDSFSATFEQLINEVHSEADYERKVTTTHVNQVGHGTCIAYADIENTNLEGDNNWWFVDTTTADLRPLEDQQGMIENGYNPFVQGYQGDQATTEVGRRQEKVIARGALLNFIDRTNDEVRWEEISVSDPMMEFVYNDHIGEQDGDVEPILDTMEKAADYQREIEGEQPVTVIGDNWDSMEIAEGQELYDAAMDMNTRVTKDTAYDIMSGAA